MNLCTKYEGKVLVQLFTQGHITAVLHLFTNFNLIMLLRNTNDLFWRMLSCHGMLKLSSYWHNEPCRPTQAFRTLQKFEKRIKSIFCGLFQSSMKVFCKLWIIF